MRTVSAFASIVVAANKQHMPVPGTTPLMARQMKVKVHLPLITSFSMKNGNISLLCELRKHSTLQAYVIDRIRESALSKPRDFGPSS